MTAICYLSELSICEVLTYIYDPGAFEDITVIQEIQFMKCPIINHLYIFPLHFPLIAHYIRVTDGNKTPSMYSGIIAELPMITNKGRSVLSPHTYIQYILYSASPKEITALGEKQHSMKRYSK